MCFFVGVSQTLSKTVTVKFSQNVAVFLDELINFECLKIGFKVAYGPCH